MHYLKHEIIMRIPLLLETIHVQSKINSINIDSFNLLFYIDTLHKKIPLFSLTMAMRASRSSS